MIDAKQFAEKSRSLIQKGRAALAAAGWDGQRYGGEFPPATEYMRIRTEALNLLARVCGADSEHHRQLRKLADAGTSSTDLPEVLGIIEAAVADVQGGFLFDLKSVVAAEILDDFIEQAQALWEAGYHVAAASLAGAVLEDGLRKLCDRHAVPLPAKLGIENLNVALAKANQYDKLVQKRITHLADLRNKADHGEFDKVKKDDVRDMIDYVRRFMSDCLGGSVR